jgi:hypothetical protein
MVRGRVHTNKHTSQLIDLLDHPVPVFRIIAICSSISYQKNPDAEVRSPSGRPSPKYQPPSVRVVFIIVCAYFPRKDSSILWAHLLTCLPRAARPPLLRSLRLVVEVARGENGAPQRPRALLDRELNPSLMRVRRRPAFLALPTWTSG